MKNYKRKNKRGVSVLIGYVLLVVFAIIISIGVYTWLKSYIPSQTLNCKDGISLAVTNATFNSGTGILNLTIKNNGRFNVAGYFIHATNSPNQSIANLDLSQYLNESVSGIKFGGSVLFSATAGDTFEPEQKTSNIFNVPSSLGTLYSLEIVPVIFQNDTSENRNRFTSCGNDKISQPL